MTEFILSAPNVQECMYYQKTYKSNIPLGPIWSMVGSANDVLARCLVEILDLVSRTYTDYFIPDSFKLA